MTRHPLKVRVAGVKGYYYAQALGFNKQPGKVVKKVPELANLLNKVAGETPGKLMLRYGQLFEKTGSVHDPPRGHYKEKPGKMPRDKALEASIMMKKGYFDYFPSDIYGTYRQEHRYYGTIEEACLAIPEMMAIKEKYGYTYEQLRVAMYKADPALKGRYIRPRWFLTEEEMDKRQTRAKSLFNKLSHGGNTDWIRRLYCVDALHFVIDHEMKKGVHIYIDAHDKGYQDVITWNKLKASQPICISILGAVNMVQGGVYIDFVTGTTDIQRRENKHEGKYKVRAVHVRQP